MPNTLTINQNTTARQIEDFLANDVNQDRKVLARHNERGEVVLYEKAKPSGLMEKVGAFVDRVLGRTEKREQRALDVVSSALKKSLEGNTHKLSGVLSERVQEAAKRGENGAPAAGKLRELLVIARSLPNGTGTVSSRSGHPSLQSLGMGPDDPAIRQAVTRLAGDPSKTNEVIGTLRDAIVAKFLQGNPGIGDREAFAFSDGLKLMDELKTALTAAASSLEGKPDISHLLSPDNLNRIFLGAASRVLPDRVDETKSVEISWGQGGTKRATLSNINLNGREYEPVRFLGEGGFANVYEFRAVSDPNDKIAVKVTRGLDELFDGRPDDYVKTIKSAGEEIGLHRTAYGEGCEQVVGYLGGLRMPDGNVAVAMEIAPNGTVHSMGHELVELVKQGKLSPQEADVLRLTMTKDMLRGLEHMHGTQGVTHYDFKSPNCFIGTDGTVKVGDFGLTLRMEETAGQDRAAGPIDNPIYKAPEILRSENVMKRVDELTEEGVTRLTKPVLDKLRGILPDGKYSEQLLNTLAGSILAEPIDELRSAGSSDKSMLFFDRSVDIWGLGSSLVEMFNGQRLMANTGFMWKVEDDLIAYGGNRNNRALTEPNGEGKLPEGAIGRKTGNDQVDDLINSMLMPDPRDRPSTAQLLTHPAFQARGVDSKEARDLIVALKSGEPDKIDNARRALAGRLTISSSSPSGQDGTMSVQEVFDAFGGNPSGARI